MVSDFIESGGFQRHVRKMRTLYEERRDGFARAAELEAGAFMRLRAAHAGMQVIGDVRIDAERLATLARRHHLSVTPLSTFHLEPASAPDALVLGFAPVPIARQKPALRTLAALAREVDPSRGVEVALDASKPEP